MRHSLAAVESAAVNTLMSDPSALGAAVSGMKPAAPRLFKRVDEDRYRWTLPDLGIAFEVERLRRQHHELLGELCVRCDLPGARTVNGTLSVADFNLSSARARTERAKLLAERGRGKGIDWGSLVEEFTQRVLAADRAGMPAVDLRTLERPSADNDTLTIEGLVLPRRHPAILFGDGGTSKSYTALYLAGRMAEQGASVALFDWELAGDDHRDRLERLFPEGMPRVWYARCEKPLVYEADRLRRIVQDNHVEYTIFDSVAFACDGPPEAAEVAGRYFRAVRQIGGGSLHIAHISKAEGADKKPFGSTFWHNGARSTWYVKLAEGTEDSDVLSVGFFNRKSNLGRVSAPVGFTVTFTENETVFKRASIADNPDLAAGLSVTQRMTHLLKRGSLTVTQIAEELEVEVNTVTQALNRNLKKGRGFTVLEGERTSRRIGLLARDRAS